MQDKNKKAILIYFLISILMLFGVIVTQVYVFASANKERVIEQNSQYLSDSASQSEREMEDFFNNAITNIKLISMLVEAEQDVDLFDYTHLKSIKVPTVFDNIRYVDKEGYCWNEKGESIYSAQSEYYIEGIKGETGVCYIDVSRFGDEPAFIFYAPLSCGEGCIDGVIYGTITDSYMKKKLETEYFGYEAASAIGDMEGNVLTATNASGKFLEEQLKTLPKETIDEMAQTLREGKNYTLRYKAPVGMGVAIFSSILEDKFVLVQTMPSRVAADLTNEANKSGIMLETSIVLAFLGYLLVVGIYSYKNTTILKKQTKSLSEIVDSVQRLYHQFMVFDLDNNTYEYLEKGSGLPIDIPRKGNFDTWLNSFKAYQENSEYTWFDMDTLNPDTLRTTLTEENWFTHTEYARPGDIWERLYLIKLDEDKNKTSRILGAVEDITGMKRRELKNREALEVAFHAAEASNRAKSEFLSRMSHDIRTPMNAIIGLTAIMGAHLDDRDRIVDSLSKISSSGKHLLSIINDVLDMSKIESGKLELAQTQFNIPELMDNLIDIVQPTVKTKRQELIMRANNLVHEDVIGDDHRLQQVFVNLLSNAVKYTPEEGHIWVTIEEKGEKTGIAEYEFVFQDDGIGMSEEFLERLFTPFERAEDERTSTIQGTGLGMPIAQSILQLMGGKISVESALGKGTKFTVRISMKLPQRAEQADVDLMGLNVLVVDDEQIDCDNACQILGELGMKGEFVLSGAEAIKSITKRHGDNDDYFAILIDWNMPGMDGIETSRRIRTAVGDKLPIVIITSYDWAEFEAEARAAGVNVFITKPLFKTRLRTVFSRLISDGKEEETFDLLGATREADYTGKHVLLAEDNILNQEIAKEILEMTGLTVDVAENGFRAAKMFGESENNYYDIIFMDIQMPVMNGLDATKSIRAMEREDAATVPIVAMTANTFSDDVQASLDAGMNKHIGKPLDIALLMSVLAEFLG